MKPTPTSLGLKGFVVVVLTKLKASYIRTAGFDSSSMFIPFSLLVMLFPLLLLLDPK
uniref:Transmembrane protein n=1 Tax=Arundo donax TaxID=35708 RepID=A0A0A9A2C3_ARUDO